MESTTLPRLLFPITPELKKLYYSALQNASLFFVDDADQDYLVLWINNQGYYVPEFDQPPPAQKGTITTFTPYHRHTHSRFTVNIFDNREEIYWILKELEAASFSGAEYIPVRCFDYVLPDLADRAQGYSERLSVQFFVRTEGTLFFKSEPAPQVLLDNPAYTMDGVNLVDGAGNIIYKTQQGYFHKISLFFEINRN